jgi:hypothetical protein
MQDPLYPIREAGILPPDSMQGPPDVKKKSSRVFTALDFLYASGEPSFRLSALHACTKLR